MAVIAEVIINRPAKQLNKPFSYEVPEAFGRIQPGTRVAVPLGHSKEEGIVIGCTQTSGIVDSEVRADYTLKPILDILDDTPWFTEEMLSTANYLSHYYITPYSDTLRLFTIDKKGLKNYRSPQELELSFIEGTDVPDMGRKKKQAELILFLRTHGAQTVKSLQGAGFSSAVIKSVAGLPCISSQKTFKETKSSFTHVLPSQDIPLTAAQQICFDAVASSIVKEQSNVFLLHGVTGSGKTQVYIKSAQECIRKGLSCIVLVPEIILTNQIVQRFVKIFGDNVVVFHSKLTKAERYNNWERLRRGDSKIIIGARSAIFAPIENIGLIILDEEHDSSYKQEEMTRYHARKVALIRGQKQNCPVLLGSATPSIESYKKALSGEYKLLELKERIYLQPLPKVQVIDMKEELFYGNRTVFSEALRELIKETLTRKKQMILLLNRRGYSTFVLCRDCGESIQCPHCDTSMIYHKENERLRCHYCEFSEPVPTECPHCGSKKIKFFGTGTQKVEEALHCEFPAARIVRLDQDVTMHKGGGEAVLQAFGNGEFDILLGTQMVSKGHDFKNVFSVGILTADSILNIPNYTASERTFDLLTQTAGRAGRDDGEGKVVIQTYNPSHYAIIYSKTHDYISFYKEEIKFRESLNYPPFESMVHIVFRHKNKKTMYDNANKAVSDLLKFSDGLADKAEIFGPYEDSIGKIRDYFRVSIMVKGKNLSSLKEYIYNSWIFTCEGTFIDVDPI